MCNEEKGCVTFNVNCCGGGSNNGNETLLPSIGENGNWFIGDQDTGIAAQGPAGETGSKGDEGKQGPQGEVGPQGPKGENGITPHIDEATGHWFIGNMDTGITAQGPEVGVQGPQGETGPQGPQGIQGPKGDKGDTGAQGPAGPQGPKGDNGQDADMSRLEALEDKVNGLDSSNYLKDYLIVMQKTMSETINVPSRRELETTLFYDTPSGYDVLLVVPRDSGYQDFFMKVTDFNNSGASIHIKNSTGGDLGMTPSVFVMFVKKPLSE